MTASGGLDDLQCQTRIVIRRVQEVSGSEGGCDTVIKPSLNAWNELVCLCKIVAQ